MEAFMLLRDMLGGPPEPIDAFVREHVAACNADRNADRTALAAILPSHPKWFSTPESGEDVSYVLVVARPLAEVSNTSACGDPVSRHQDHGA